MIETEGAETMSDLSAADVLAMTKDNSGFLEGNGIIILLLFLLFLGGGFGTFGNTNASAQGSLTRAEMQDGFNNQNTVNTLNNLNMGMTNGFNNIAIGMTNGFNGINQNINTLGFNMQQCCCDLKTTIATQGDLTRQLINENTMQNLRDVISDKNRQISEATFDASQATQTAQLEAFILANKSTTTTA